MAKKIYWIIGGIVVLWVAGSFYVLSKAPASLFVAAQRERSKQVTLPPEYQHEFMKNKAAEKLEFVIVPNPTTKDVILYFHGNSGRIPELMAQAAKTATVISPSYPGYSQSEGSPTNSNVYETADLAMKYLDDHGYDQSRVTVLGHSLGGAPAVYVGANYPGIHRLILVNTLNSVLSLCWPKYYVLCGFTYNYFNSGRLAKRITVPTRVFHDEGDTVIPYSQGKILFDSVAGSNKKFETLAGSHSMFDYMMILED